MRTALALFLLLPAAEPAKTSAPSPAASLAEAERAFAKMCVAKGTRESFLASFADDGIEFSPSPVVVKASIAKQPVPPRPPAERLDWEPAIAEVSASGDLGFTTGPFVFTDYSEGQPSSTYGYYFSIWKRAPGGPWKVAVDAGTTLPTWPGPLRPRTLAEGRVLWTGTATSGTPAEDRAVIEKRDRDLQSAADRRAAFLPDGRLHRTGISPLSGAAELGDFLGAGAKPFAAHPIGSAVASTRDFGYTYGSYETATADAPETGFYVRVWKRDAAGEWKIAVEVERPNPPARK